jgi:carbon storage regulator
MLVLSRRERERIKVGDSIIVTIVRVSGDRVRIGIEAPADVIVLREELQPRTEPVSANAEVLTSCSREIIEPAA